MADLVITAANVSNASPGTGEGTAIAGVALTAGQSVYIDANGKAQLTNATGTVLVASSVGICLCNAAAGQPVTYQKSGVINIGATVVLGGTYCVSGAVAGNICPVADIVTNWRTCIHGFATTTAQLTLIENSAGAGVQHA